MARKQMDEMALFQFAPDACDVSYDFSAFRLMHNRDVSYATRMARLSGQITYPENSRYERFDLSVYAGSENLDKESARNQKPIGHFGSKTGHLNGAVWVPDDHFSLVTVLTLSEKLRCISVHARKSGHARGSWLITNFSMSTEAEI